MCFVKLTLRISIDKADRGPENKKVHKCLQRDCPKLMDVKDVLSCAHHDVNNTYVQKIKKIEKKTHTKENELKGIKHGITLSTYFGKILKPSSCFGYSKSSYFVYYVQKNHPDVAKHVFYLFRNIKYCKSQRGVNLAHNGIYLYHLIPFLLSIKQYTWRNKDIFTKKQQRQIDGLRSSQIKSELFIGSFFFDKVYLSFFRATKQYSDWKCLPTIVYCLKMLNKMSMHCGYFIDLFLSVNTLLHYSNEHSNVLQLSDTSYSQTMNHNNLMFGKSIIIIISLFYLYDPNSSDNDQFNCSQLKAIIRPIWNNIQETCANIVNAQNLMLSVVLKMDIDSVFVYINRIQRNMYTIYVYLNETCDWATKYGQHHEYLKHIPNNTDSVESTHGAGSRVSKTNEGLSAYRLRLKVLCGQNRLVDTLLAMYLDPTKHKILFWIFDNVLNLNVAQYKRQMLEEERIHESNKNRYYDKYMKRKSVSQRITDVRRPRAVLQDVQFNYNKSRTSSEMLGPETEVDENEYSMMMHEMNDNGANVGLRENSNRPRRRSPRKKRKVVSYKDDDTSDGMDRN
eukprot:69684_1